MFGGRSSEHGISCVSGGNVLGAIDRDKFEVVAVGITREGSWRLVPDEPERYRIRTASCPLSRTRARAFT